MESHPRSSAAIVFVSSWFFGVEECTFKVKQLMVTHCVSGHRSRDDPLIQTFFELGTSLFLADHGLTNNQVGGCSRFTLHIQ